MAENKKVTIQFPGIGGLLTILFVGLKLTGNIDWAWVWVLSPLWIGAGLFFMVMLFLLIVAALAAISSK